MNTNDWVLYHDSSQYIKEGFKYNIKYFINNLLSHNISLIPGIRMKISSNFEWTSGYPFCHPIRCTNCSICNKTLCPLQSNNYDTIIQLNNFCSNITCINQYKRIDLMQSSWNLWKKDEFNLKILKEWMSLYYNKYSLLYFPFQDQHALKYIIHKYNITIPYLHNTKHKHLTKHINCMSNMYNDTELLNTIHWLKISDPKPKTVSFPH